MRTHPTPLLSAMIGKKFGRLQVLEFSGFNKGEPIFKCKCSFCGNVCLSRRRVLVHGKGDRCFQCRGAEDLSGDFLNGMLLLKYVKQESGKTGWEGLCPCGSRRVFNLESLKLRKSSECFCEKQVSQDGLSKTREYRTWCAMRGRCKPGKDAVKDRNYYGRGIRVCGEWDDPKTGFKKFLEDMGDAPTPRHTLDRKNGDKGYSKANCRWATPAEQVKNRRPHMALGGFSDAQILEEAKRRGIIT